MSLRRSAGNGGAAKVSRKVRVVLGKSKGSGDGAGTLESKSRSTGKRPIRVRLITEKRSNDDVREREPRKMGVKKVKSRGNGDDAALKGDVDEKSSGKGRREKRDFKAKNVNEKLSERESIGRRDSKTKILREELNGRASIGKRDMKTKTRKAGFEEVTVGKFRQVQTNATGNGILQNKEKVKNSLATRKNVRPSESAVGSLEKAHKKRDQGKRNLATDSDVTEMPRKKKKRDIRIDPHDTSNKRLDDSIKNKDDSQTKKDSKENASKEDAGEMSKNAQFRAIRPSASILSFVEDNLLGRRRDIEFRKAGYNTEISSPLDNIPFSTGSERERIEVPVFKNKLEFFAAAKVSSSFPPPELPEIAFAGRSNVGKSSLLNSLTRQWGVVRTSDKPGLTQTINFFKLGPKLSLVDLPGYGFAYAKDEVKEAWEELVKEYVSTRASLRRVCLLIDTKWGMKPRDHELIDLMERSQTKYQIVLTKTDLVFPIDVARRAMQIEENLKAKKSAVQPLMMVSSRTGAGIRSLRTVLATVARLVKH